MRAPNLYRHFRLNEADNSTALGVLLAGMDARLATEGHELSSTLRKQTMIGYAVLSDDARRALYDHALEAGRDVSWRELEHLGNFGVWPEEFVDWTEPEPEPEADYPGQARPTAVRGQQQANPFAQQVEHQLHPQVDPKVNAVAPVFGQATGALNYAGLQNRPSMSVRFWMAFWDGMLALLIGGAVAAPFGNSSDGASLLIIPLVMIAYFVITEVAWGGSPVKLAAGYEVRDIDTGKRLTPEQALKRNWFRVIQIIPGVGQAISLIGALLCIFSINPENSQRGLHDRFANAEVTKKKPR